MCCSLCEPDKPTPVASEYSRRRPLPLIRYNWCPWPGLKNFVTNGAVRNTMEHMSKTSADVSEVVFDQPEERAGAMELDGSVLNRHKEEEWLEDTEPYHGADLGQRNSTGRSMRYWVPLQVEKRKMLNCVTLWFRDCIRNSKFGRRRRYRRHHEGNHAGTRVTNRKGPRAMTDEAVLGPGGLADQRKDTTGRNRQNDEWSPVAALEDTVSRMQRDLEDLQTENRFLRTPRASVPVPLVRQAALTTTKVPWFNGSTSWEQYQQVFDAIVLSNGWGDATAALQLLSHLQDDALSVALLIPMLLRASRKELTDALSSHYGSPGRLENYRREFDKTVRKPGEDPSNFAIIQLWWRSG